MKIGEMNIDIPEGNISVRLTNLEIDFKELIVILKTIRELQEKQRVM